jgi:anaerobic ribonucleoside-triphosphate reductase
MPLEICYGCGKKVSITTDQCPKCGEREPTPTYRRRPTYGKSRFWIFFAIGLLIATCFIVII